MAFGTFPARPVDRIRVALNAVLVTACIVAVLLAIGAAVPTWGKVGVAAGVAVLATGATIYNPMAIPLFAMPILTSVYRVGGGSVNLSLSDFVLFAVFWIALTLGKRPYSRPMRTVLWISTAYQLATLFTVVANPYTANIVEWFHAYLDVGGAILVGWAVARAGFARAALTLYLSACLALALIVIVTGATMAAQGRLGPVFVAWPYGMHKNFEGDVLGIAALVAYARPPWLRWPDAFAMPAFVVLVVAVAATQARQAIIGLGVGLIILVLRPGQGVRHSRKVLWLIPAAALLVIRAVGDQLASDDQFNSSYQRLTWYQESLTVFQYRPLFGVGLRWWYNPWFPHDFQAFQPPQGLLEVLTSAGIVGLAGFLLMNFGMIGSAWRLDPRFGTLAAVVVFSRFVQGQFDLYWVSVQTSMPFLIVGICLGALAHHEARPSQALDLDLATIERPVRLPA